MDSHVLKLHNIVDAIALYAFAEGAFTQAQIAQKLNKDYFILGLSESAHKRAVTRLFEFGFIEADMDIKIPMQERGGKFYRITRLGKDELFEIEKLFFSLRGSADRSLGNSFGCGGDRVKEIDLKGIGTKPSTGRKVDIRIFSGFRGYEVLVDKLFVNTSSTLEQAIAYVDHFNVVWDKGINVSACQNLNHDPNINGKAMIRVSLKHIAKKEGGLAALSDLAGLCRDENHIPFSEGNFIWLHRMGLLSESVKDPRTSRKTDKPRWKVLDLVKEAFLEYLVENPNLLPNLSKPQFPPPSV